MMSSLSSKNTSDMPMKTYMEFYNIIKEEEWLLVKPFLQQNDIQIPSVVSIVAILCKYYPDDYNKWKSAFVYAYKYERNKSCECCDVKEKDWIKNTVKLWRGELHLKCMCGDYFIFEHLCSKFGIDNHLLDDEEYAEICGWFASKNP